MHKNNHNAGMSLVELLVVVAIMGVVIGMATLSYNLVKKTNVNQAASTIEDYLSTCRQKAKTISAYEWNVTIQDNTITLYKFTQVGEEITPEVIQTTTIPSNVDIYLADYEGNRTYTSDSGEDMDAITVSFKPLSGSVKEIYYSQDGSKITGPSVTEGSYCDLVSEYKNKKTSTVRLYFSTGKHSIID